MKRLILIATDEDTCKARNLINQEKAQELYKRHLLGEVNVAKEIWKWVHLEL